MFTSSGVWLCNECLSEHDMHVDVPMVSDQDAGMFCSMDCFDAFAKGLWVAGVSVGLRPGEEPDVVS